MAQQIYKKYNLNQITTKETVKVQKSKKKHINFPNNMN
jgi:hypothetical protein